MRLERLILSLDRVSARSRVHSANSFQLGLFLLRCCDKVADGTFLDFRFHFANAISFSTDDPVRVTGYGYSIPVVVADRQ
jgi:hypothetical protein